MCPPPPQQHRGALSSHPNPRLWGWGRGQCPQTPPSSAQSGPVRLGGGGAHLGGRGRGVLGGVSGARTLLRINLFTKGKPNTFSTMDYWGGERERDEDTAQSGRREEGDSVCWVGGGEQQKEGWGGGTERERKRDQRWRTTLRRHGAPRGAGGTHRTDGRTDVLVWGGGRTDRRGAGGEGALSSPRSHSSTEHTAGRAHAILTPTALRTPALRPRKGCGCGSGGGVGCGGVGRVVPCDVCVCTKVLMSRSVACVYRDSA